MTSVLIAASFLVLVLSGVLLFVSPPGRIANWTNWTILGLRKHDWIGLHIWFSVLFLLVAIVHLVFNLPENLAFIRSLYPQDAATGFKLGDLRGAWRVDFPRAALRSK